jgi:four helix bundle protein
MTTAKTFEEIVAWQKARALVKRIYESTRQDSFSRDYPLRDQVRKAAISIMANIAEGFERGGNKEFMQFLSVAKASTAEVKSHLYVALDQNYLTQSVFEEVTEYSNEVARMMTGLMKYLSSSSLRGSKFKQSLSH